MSEKTVHNCEAVQSNEILAVGDEVPDTPRSTLETVLLMSALSVR